MYSYAMLITLRYLKILLTFQSIYQKQIFFPYVYQGVLRFPFYALHTPILLLPALE